MAAAAAAEVPALRAPFAGLALGVLGTSVAPPASAFSRASETADKLLPSFARTRSLFHC